MEKPIIEIKNIGKHYKINHERGGYVALRDVLANIFRNPFKFLKIKAKQISGLEKKEEFWALKNINLNVKRGEIIGIIGHNGAGKSTLLKILSQITPPTEGEIILRGKVGSLLEVGTGFHPELTGRENIFLNGAIIGMTRKDIASKFDSIVAFAEIEKFLDTPVKYYSSGMYVRLAFSVAAHMESDILIVDEVLAVGDSEFQKKCIGKIDDITKSQGRSILFVSHNMGTIQELCQKTIVLEKGKVIFEGKTEEAIKIYSSLSSNSRNIDLLSATNRRGNGKIKLTNFHIEDTKGNITNIFAADEDAVFVFSYQCNNPKEIKDVDVGFSIQKFGIGLTIIYSSDMHKKYTDVKKSGEFRFLLKKIPFATGQYQIGARLLANNLEADWPKDMVGELNVTGTNSRSIIDIYGEWL